MGKDHSSMQRKELRQEWTRTMELGLKKLMTAEDEWHRADQEDIFRRGSQNTELISTANIQSFLH